MVHYFLRRGAFANFMKILNAHFLFYFFEGGIFSREIARPIVEMPDDLCQEDQRVMHAQVVDITQLLISIVHHY